MVCRLVFRVTLNENVLLKLAREVTNVLVVVCVRVDHCLLTSHQNELGLLNSKCNRDLFAQEPKRLVVVHLNSFSDGFRGVHEALHEDLHAHHGADGEASLQIHINFDFLDAFVAIEERAEDGDHAIFSDIFHAFVHEFLNQGGLDCLQLPQIQIDEQLGAVFSGFGLLGVETEPPQRLHPFELGEVSDSHKLIGF